MSFTEPLCPLPSSVVIICNRSVHSKQTQHCSTLFSLPHSFICPLKLPADDYCLSSVPIHVRRAWATACTRWTLTRFLVGFDLNFALSFFLYLARERHSIFNKLASTCTYRHKVYSWKRPSDFDSHLAVIQPRMASKTVQYIIFHHFFLSLQQINTTLVK